MKQPNSMLCLSVTARSALTGFMKAIAATYIKNNVTVNNLLPENFATDRLRSNVQRLSSTDGKTLDEAMAAKAAATPARRFGELDEFGVTCAFYWPYLRHSPQAVEAGYIYLRPRESCCSKSAFPIGRGTRAGAAGTATAELA